MKQGFKLRSKTAQELNNKGFSVNYTVYVHSLDDNCNDEQEDKAHYCTKNTAKNTVGCAKEINAIGKLAQQPCQNAEKDDCKNEGYDVTDNVGDNVGNRLRNGRDFLSDNVFFGLQEFR